MRTLYLVCHGTEERKGHVCHVHKAINPMTYCKVAVIDKSLGRVITIRRQQRKP